MQKITPFFWFESQGEEAAKFYVDVFNSAPGSRKNSRVGTVARYDKAGAEVSGRPEGSAMTVEFELDGQEFAALNGGPEFKFTEAVSFLINCTTQEEVDHFWTKLTEGGQEVQCGWLKDRYGLSWQVVPTILNELLSDPDSKKAGRTMQAMLKMVKMDIAALKRAHEGK